MNPVNFPEATVPFGPPADLDESQCGVINAFVGRVEGGNVDGARQVVVAWKPTAEELAELNAGGAVYLSMLGGLLPHFLCTSFDVARRVG